MLLSNLDVLATAPGGVARLRELILTLAVQGKLLPQDPADEPASELLKKIRAEKDRLIAEGKIKRDKPLAGISEEEQPFEVPVGWEWVRFGEIGLIGRRNFASDIPLRNARCVPRQSCDMNQLSSQQRSGTIQIRRVPHFDRRVMRIGKITHLH